MKGRRERNFVGEVINHKPHSCLTLAMWLLIDRGGYCAFVKIWSHISEQIGSDEFHLSRHSAGPQRTADRKTLDRVHIESSQRRNPAKKVKRLLKALVLVFVPFNDRYYRSSRAMLWKGLGEAICLPAMVFRTQHARNEGHFRTRRNKLSP